MKIHELSSLRETRMFSTIKSGLKERNRREVVNDNKGRCKEDYKGTCSFQPHY